MNKQEDVLLSYFLQVPIMVKSVLLYSAQSLIKSKAILLKLSFRKVSMYQVLFYPIRLRALIGKEGMQSSSVKFLKLFFLKS